MSSFLNQRTVLESVRDLVDQIAYGKATSQDDLVDFGYSDLSDEAIIDFIESACRHTAATVSAQHLPELLQSFDPNAAVPTGILRIVGDRVERNDIKARRLSFASLRSLGPLRQPSATFPVYAYEDLEMDLQPSGSGQAWAVTIPEGVDTTFAATATIGSKILAGAGFDYRIEGAVVTIPGAGTGGGDFTSVIEFWYSANAVGLAHPVENSVAATTATYRLPATRNLRSRLLGAVASRAAELAFLALKRPDLAGLCNQRFRTAVGAIAIPTR